MKNSLLILGAWLLSTSAAAVELVSVRYSNTDERTRIVLDLTEKPQFSRVQADELFEIQIDGLQRVGASALLRIKSPRIQFESIDANNRLKFRLIGDPRVKTFLVEPDPKNEKLDRLVVDLFNPSTGQTAPQIVKKSTPAKPVQPKPMSVDQAMGIFERDIDVIRDAVQHQQLALTDADELTVRKRKAVANRFALANQQPVLYPDAQESAAAITPSNEKLHRTNAARKTTALPKRTQAKAGLIAAPMPIGIHQAKPTNPAEQSCRLAAQLVSQVSDSGAVRDLRFEEFERRITAVQNALKNGQLTKAQAAELIARQRRLFAATGAPGQECNMITSESRSRDLS